MNNLLGSALGVSTTVLNPILRWAIVLVPIAIGGVTYALVARAGGEPA
jgi:hypothetical protein